MSFKILVITPVTHIKNVPEVLQSIGKVTFFDDPSLDQVLEIISGYDAIYTNPNKSKVFIGRELLDKASNLKGKVKNTVTKAKQDVGQAARKVKSKAQETAMKAKAGAQKVKRKASAATAAFKSTAMYGN